MDNKKTSSKSFVFSVCVFSFLIAVRVLLIKDEDIVKGMAILNVLALDYVFIAICYEPFMCIQNELRSSSFPASVVKRKMRSIIAWLVLVFIIIFGAGLVYFCLFSRALINDIIAIVALFASIEDEVLSRLSGKIMKRIIKI